MTKYKGSLELNWINKDKSLLYEIDEEEGMGVKPVWVEKDDIRVSEPRILKLKEEYGDPDNDNMLIKGDNLLALKTLVEDFKNRDEKDKVKCIYIDPPFNTGSAFEHYDDNLEHSQWLTMVKDRLVLLKKVLREDGAIFIHIDYQEIGYLIPLMDEIFGRYNFVQLISVKAASPAGFKTVNPGPIDVTEYILFYTKNKPKFEFTKLHVPIFYDQNYNLLIKNPMEHPSNWEFESIISAIYRREKIPDWDNLQKAWRHAERKWGRNWKIIRESFIAEYAIENAHRLVSIRDPHKPTDSLKEKLEESRKNPNTVLVFERDGYSPLHLYNGGSLAFYKNKVKTVDGRETATQLLTDFWDDISWAGIAREGNVKFKNSKKPEKLIKRIILMTAKPGEIVLDSFLGSGTTAAVSHKMLNRWIGIELGNHADTHCLKRLKKVVSGKDKSGISKDEDINWKGGGGFRYYVIGNSIIKDLDMNWDMTLSEMSRAVFMNFDYSMIDGDTHRLEADGDEFYLGKQKGGIAICLVTKSTKIIRRKELNKLIKYLFKKYPNQKVTIFTNMGVAVKPEELGDKLDVRKIPESILKKYRMV